MSAPIYSIRRYGTRGKYGVICASSFRWLVTGTLSEVNAWIEEQDRQRRAAWQAEQAEFYAEKQQDRA